MTGQLPSKITTPDEARAHFLGLADSRTDALDQIKRLTNATDATIDYGGDVWIEIVTSSGELVYGEWLDDDAIVDLANRIINTTV